MHGQLSVHAASIYIYIIRSCCLGPVYLMLSSSNGNCTHPDELSTFTADLQAMAHQVRLPACSAYERHGHWNHGYAACHL